MEHLYNLLRQKLGRSLTEQEINQMNRKPIYFYFFDLLKRIAYSLIFIGVVILTIISGIIAGIIGGISMLFLPGKPKL
ncbi:MAG: hypothetical protein K9J21_07095 [Bacteroidales bacterium]|nr:hypothetical protein [Bacteroidales bacterium]